MPSYTPTRASVERIGVPHPLWFVSQPARDKQGAVVKADDGTFSYSPAVLGSPDVPGTAYSIGRSGYYLTPAEAREAIGDSEVYGISYVDDYNDEYSDFYVCSLATNTPNVPAVTAEPIH